MTKHKSSVWQYFTRKRIGDKIYAECQFCKTRYYNNATRMAAHLRSCQPNMFGDKDNSISSQQSSSMLLELSTLSPARLKEAFPSMPLLPKENKCDSKPLMALSTFVDRLTDNDQRSLEQSFARAVYATGTPFNMAENLHWINFFKQLRPDFRVPSQQMLSDTLLDAESERVSNEVKSKLQLSDGIAIITEGLTSINQTPIINFILTTPEPLFYKSVVRDEMCRNGDYIAEEISRVINEVGASKVLAVVSDNAADMMSTMSIIQTKHSHVYCYGCINHGLHLFASDICSLEYASEIITKSKEIVKFIKYKHVPHAAFERAQKAIIKQSRPLNLFIPSTARWGTVALMLKRLLKMQKLLQCFVAEEEVESTVPSSVKANILNKCGFWTQVKSLHNLLQPITDALKEVNTDRFTISDVPQIFHNLRQHFKQVLRCAPVQRKEGNAIQKYLALRQEFCTSNLHLVAHLLDPKYCGVRLTDDQISMTYDTVCELTTKLSIEGCSVELCMSELAEFRAKSGTWREGGPIWHAAQHTSPATWWKGLCPNKALSKIASHVLNLPATSTAAQRNWNTHKHILSTKKNRLTDSRIQKVLNVAYNLKSENEEKEMQGQSDKSSSDGDSDLDTTELMDMEDDESMHDDCILIS